MNVWVFNGEQLERLLVQYEKHESAEAAEAVRRFFGSSLVRESKITQWAPDPGEAREQ